MRRIMEAGAHPARWENTSIHIATHLERRDARDVSHKCQDLKVEHQLDVFFPVVRHADRCGRQLAGLAATVLLFDSCDTPFNLAHILEILIQSLPIRGPDRGLY